MKTIQMTLDEKLVKLVDIAVKKLGTTRSAFTRHALYSAIDEMKTLEMEKKQIDGYIKHAKTKDEFSVWESEQKWND
jgi:metal-responsive CopG/Arc/MetJ family transcriptional regulator